MLRSRLWRVVVTVAAACIGLAPPAHAVLPLIAGIGKQIVQNMLLDGVKSQLMGSLSGMGCKGAAVASLVGAGGSRAGGLSSLMPGLPGGRSLPPGIAPPSGANPDFGEAWAMRAVRGAPEIATLPAGAGPRSMDMSQTMALMQRQLGAHVPAGHQMTPEQMAQVNASMAGLQQAMAQPLSSAETIAVFDELAALGVMTPAMKSETSDCVQLAPPGADASLGVTAALFKNMVLSQMRAARERLANLQPDGREMLVNEIANAMNDASPEDRQAFQEGFRPRVLSALCSRCVEGQAALSVRRGPSAANGPGSANSIATLPGPMSFAGPRRVTAA